MNYLTGNFTDMVMNANKVNPQHLVGVWFLLDIHFYKLLEGAITALQTFDCDWSPHMFIEVNFSKLTECNHIFRSDFVVFIITLYEISSQIIE